LPNASVDSPLVAIVKALVAILSPSERAFLRPWLLARYDVAGRPARGFTDRKPGEST